LAFLVLAGALVLIGSEGCIVVAIQHFYDEKTLTFDEHLLGVWTDADDHVTVTVERGEWQSYRITYDHPTEKGTLTGLLFMHNGQRYLDLMPIRGVDQGSFMLPAHALVKIGLGEAVSVSPLRFDWFDAALDAHTLPASLGAARGERSQLVLGATAAVLGKWLLTRPAIDPAFGPSATFTRQ
jgi:hypothetical protein